MTTFLMLLSPLMIIAVGFMIHPVIGALAILCVGYAVRDIFKEGADHA